MIIHMRLADYTFPISVFYTHVFEAELESASSTHFVLSKTSNFFGTPEEV
eukprot:m.107208 g.107208  ORF g.107208 m.107208 type:complete len:50 (-) comp12686_c1_seq1:477-626(-)